MQNAPGAHNALLLALEEHLTPPTSVILRGDGSPLTEWKNKLEETYDPMRACYAIPASALDLPGLLAQHRVETEVTAYVCRGHQCLAPITDLAELAQLFIAD